MAIFSKVLNAFGEMYDVMKNYNLPSQLTIALGGGGTSALLTAIGIVSIIISILLTSVGRKIMKMAMKKLLIVIVLMVLVAYIVFIAVPIASFNQSKKILLSKQRATRAQESLPPLRTTN